MKPGIARALVLFAVVLCGCASSRPSIDLATVGYQTAWVRGQKYDLKASRGDGGYTLRFYSSDDLVFYDVVGSGSYVRYGADGSLKATGTFTTVDQYVQSLADGDRRSSFSIDGDSILVGVIRAIVNVVLNAG